MSEHRRSWLLVIAGGAVVGLLLVLGVALFLLLTGSLSGVRAPARFESNGAQIYFTGTSQRGTPIVAQMRPGMGRMRGSRLTCASCHGPGGRGGQVRMMMRLVQVPDIRHESLTSEEHHGEGSEEHEPYTEEAIKLAIREGVEPSGEPLDWPMPSWSMSGEDLEDLVDFLRTLN